MSYKSKIAKDTAGYAKSPGKCRNLIKLFSLFVSVVALSISSSEALAEITPTFLYHLSNFSGTIPYNWAKISVDRFRNEIYVIDAAGSEVRVFNDQGMEIFHFADDRSLGHVYDVTVKEDGNMLVLASKGGETSVFACNFRGVVQEQVGLKELPPDFSGFLPTRIVYRQGLIYQVNTSSGKIVVTDGEGNFLSGYDPYTILGIEEKDRVNTQMGDFAVDPEGNMLFTIPVLFSAYRLAPGGELSSFGRRGGGPGGFNIVSGIAADSKGYYFLTDRLKCAVIVYDKNFQFVKEFGHRGSRPENFVSPSDLGIDAAGKLYVSQRRNRGISVFKITYQ
jgi:DNA-binding beta-propeller fold protein YncE